MFEIGVDSSKEKRLLTSNIKRLETKVDKFMENNKKWGEGIAKFVDDVMSQAEKKANDAVKRLEDKIDTLRKNENTALVLSKLGEINCAFPFMLP